MSGVSVSVAEVMELRAAGLSEREVWCLLAQMLPEMRQLAATGSMFPSAAPELALERILVGGQGRVWLPTDGAAPTRPPTECTVGALSTPLRHRGDSTQLEKGLVLAAGRALLDALHGPTSHGERSALHCLLLEMAHTDPDRRPSLARIAQGLDAEFGCEASSLVRGASVMRSLYREVLGSPPKDLPSLFAQNSTEDSKLASTHTQIFSSTAIVAKTPLTCRGEVPQQQPLHIAVTTLPPRAAQQHINIKLNGPGTIAPHTPSLQRHNSMLTRKNPVSRSVSSPSNLAREHIRRHPVHRAPSRLYRPVAPVNHLVGAKYLCPRSCVGPEFVVRSSLPSKEVWVGDDKRVGKKRVLVVLLNGQRLDVLCYSATATAGQILEAVVKQAGLTDNFMLGLALLLSGDFVFLSPDTKLAKVAPPGWLAGIHSGAEHPTFTLFVRVQLYLSSLRGVRWEAKHLLYLQLRRSLLERRLLCPLTQLVTMAGFALQAEFGDFSSKEHSDADYFILEHYIPEDLLEKGEAELRWRLQAQHEARQGLDPGRAEEAFIAAAQQLPDHGTHFYHAQQVCKDGNTSSAVQLGIKDAGIFVFATTPPTEEQEGQALVQGFEWRSIQKLCFSKQFFSLGCVSSDGKPLKLKFKMQDKKSFYVFHLASLHHQFSLRLRTEIHNMQTLSREFGIIISKQTYDPETEDRWSLRSGRLRGSGKPLSHMGVSRQASSCCEEQQNKENESPKPESLAGEAGTAKRHGVRMGTRAVCTSASQWSSKETLVCEARTGHCHQDQAYSPLPEAYIINASLKSNEEEVHLSYDESITNTLNDKLGNMSCTEERILRTIRLLKDAGGSLGIQVTEGSDGAIYIQSVVNNGAAHKQGVVKRGDQVIAVGVRSLVNLKYHEALQVLQQACSTDEGEVELVLSQLFTEDVAANSPGKQLPSQVTARYRKSRANLFPQSAVRLDIVSTLQKPVEESYLKNIRYETAVESGEMISKLLPRSNSSPNKSPSREYRVATSPSKEQRMRAVCCVAPATDED